MSYWPFIKISMWNGLGLGLNSLQIFSLNNIYPSPTVYPDSTIYCWSESALDQLWVGSTDVIWRQVVSSLITNIYIVWWYSLSARVLFGDFSWQWQYCLVIFLVSDNIVWLFSLSVYQLLVIFLVSDSSVWWCSMSVTILFVDFRYQYCLVIFHVSVPIVL